MLGRYQFKEALTSFLPHHAAAAPAYAAAPASDAPNHAHLRRATLATAGSTAWISSNPVLHRLPLRKRVCFAGECRGPLEDSGGIGGYLDLLDVLADPGGERHRELSEWASETAGPWQDFDPGFLDAAAVNRELALLFAVPSATGPGAGSGSILDDLTGRMYPGIRPEFRSYLADAGLHVPGLVESAVAEEVVAPYLWLLRRVGPEGMALTSTGWLPPAAVKDAMIQLGWEGRWIGKFSREDQTLPVLVFARARSGSACSARSGTGWS